MNTPSTDANQVQTSTNSTPTAPIYFKFIKLNRFTWQSPLLGDSNNSNNSNNTKTNRKSLDRPNNSPVHLFAPCGGLARRPSRAAICGRRGELGANAIYRRSAEARGQTRAFHCSWRWASFYLADSWKKRLEMELCDCVGMCLPFQLSNEGKCQGDDNRRRLCQ